MMKYNIMLILLHSQLLVMKMLYISMMLLILHIYGIVQLQLTYLL